MDWMNFPFGHKMELGSVERAAALAWGPTEASRHLLAAASVSGTLDLTFETTASLELLEWTPQDGALPVRRTTQAPDR